MKDGINPTQFHESEGVGDWRVLGDGATAYFRTGSFAAGARLVQAISDLPGADELHPDVDVRHDGVTVRMLTITDNYAGMTRRHVDLARQISAAARKLGLSADPSAVQSLLVIPGATSRADVCRSGRPYSGMSLAATAPPRTSSIRAVGRCLSGSSKWTSRARTAAVRSTSRSGCRTNRRRRASRRRSPRVAGSCAISSLRRGGRWPTRPATRPTSPPRRGGNEPLRDHRELGGNRWTCC